MRSIILGYSVFYLCCISFDNSSYFLCNLLQNSRNRNVEWLPPWHLNHVKCSWVKVFDNQLKSLRICLTCACNNNCHKPSLRSKSLRLEDLPYGRFLVIFWLILWTMTQTFSKSFHASLCLLYLLFWVLLWITYFSSRKNTKAFKLTCKLYPRYIKLINKLINK